MTHTVSATAVLEAVETIAPTTIAGTEPTTVTLATDQAQSPVSYEGDALTLDPALMVVGQQYAVELGDRSWWAIKRDADHIDFRKRSK
jgi:hypothetical protein